MIYADLESMLVQDDNGDPEGFYTKTQQKHVTWSYVYKLVCGDSKFTKPFKPYLDENAVNNFINGVIKESKYCSDLMKEHLKKELVINKKDKKDFENYTKCSISDNVYVDGDVKVRDHGKIKSLFMIYVHFLLY